MFITKVPRLVHRIFFGFFEIFIFPTPGRYLQTAALKPLFTEIEKNTVFPRIIAGGDYLFFRTKRKRLFEGRRLFQILLTGSRALNILF